MNQSSQLYQLQKADSELDQINVRSSEIKKILEMDDALRLAEQMADTAKKNLFQARHALKNIEESVASIRIKINLSEASLYGGKIRNPKELQDLQTEISALKRRLAALEDEQLEAMMAVEDCENKQALENENLIKATAQHASKQAALLGEQSQLIKTTERLQAQRSATLGSILPENLEIYERLRKTKRGMGVSLVEDSACSACGSTLRPAELQTARSSQQVAYCSACGRILFVG